MGYRFPHLAFNDIYQATRSLLTVVSRNGSGEKTHFSPVSIHVQARLPLRRNAKKNRDTWPPWSPPSLPMNHVSCCSYPCAALSWIWTGPMTKKTQSDIVWLQRRGPKKPCLYLSIHSVFLYFCSEQLPYRERHRAHGEAPCRYIKCHVSEHQVPCEWASVDNQPSWAFRWLLPWSPLDYSNMRDPKLELPSWAQSTHRIMKNNNVPISLKNVLDEPIKN